MPSRSGRNRLHVTGAQRPATDVDVTIHDGRMANNLAILFGDEMRPADRVLPVVFRETAFLVALERGKEQRADRGDFVSRQLGGGGSPDVRGRIMI